jgi:RimJ/RimL family protein N-acetyltransferase
MLAHPSLWPDVRNDATPPQGEFRAPAEYHYFTPCTDGEPMGLLGCRRLGADAELHAAILPPHRGKGTVRALNAMTDWLFAHGARRVVAKVEAWNVRALAAATRAGFVRCGVIPNAVPRRGRRVDLIEMELIR